MRIRVLPTLLAVLAALAWLLPATILAAPSPSGRDAFGRAVVGGWGVAETGGAWAPIGSADALGVGTGHAILRLPKAGGGGGAYQPDVAAQDVELSARLTLDRLPADGNAFGYLVGRWQDDAEIRFKVRIDSAGLVGLQATSVVGGEEAGIGDEVTPPGLVLTPGATLALRGQVVGKGQVSVRLRAWLDDTLEPSDWPVQATTSTRGLDGAGHVGVRGYLGSSVTNAPIAITFDDWSATVLDAPPGPSASPEPSPGTTAPAASPTPDVVPPGTVIATDELDRVTERGWGTAPTGGTWSHGGQGADLVADGQQGRIRTEPGATRSAALTDVEARDAQLLVTVRPERLPTGGNAFLYLVLRHVDDTEVRGRVRVAPEGGVHLGISIVRDGEEVTLGPEVRTDGLMTGPQRPIRVRFEGVGSGVTRWSIKAWPAGAAEPEGWALRVTDATPVLQGPGSIAMRAYVGRTVTSPEVTFLVDDVLAMSVSADASDPALVGAGDIAACDSPAAEATATLLDGIPGTVFAAGDLAYPDGSPAEFAACFDPTWGRHKDRMLPALGNRDYGTPGAAGWFGYFGDRLPGPDPWYATDIGSWRVYVLDTECDQVACGEGSAQLAWLRADLAANPRQCSLAIGHEPRFASGPHGDGPAVSLLWEALDAAGAELMVSGHDHDYERLLPMSPSGALDTDQGIVQMIAGTGGGGGATFVSIRANSVVQDGETFGVLKLTLRQDSWDWRFLPVAGSTFTDSGSARCHGAP